MCGRLLRHKVGDAPVARDAAPASVSVLSGYSWLAVRALVKILFLGYTRVGGFAGGLESNAYIVFFFCSCYMITAAVPWLSTTYLAPRASVLRALSVILLY